MVEHQTVLVLGAGASQPYKLPLGWELRRDICQRWADRQESDSEIEMLTPSGLTLGDMRKFARAFLQSSVGSIDAFLSRQTQFADCGKFAIAYELCRREIPERLWDFEN